MTPEIKHLQDNIQSVRQTVVQHPLYNRVQSLEDIQKLMQHHVFAVWDFMSLLKALQIHLTCTTLPWRPVGNANTRFLINEIVVGEESDVDEQGQRMSHFELYLKAMQQVGADASAIHALMQAIQAGKSIDQALSESNIPESVKTFLSFTFEVVNCQKPHVIAAVFTFGREDLIPEMFMALVKDLSEKLPNQLEVFKYYLDRHIEVDGDHHSHLAIAMTEDLCENDPLKWAEAERYVIRALESRRALWDGVMAAL